MTASTSQAGPTPSALRRQLAALVAVVAVADFAFGAVNVVHMTSAGLAPSTIGLVLAVAGIASTVVEAPSGALGDLFGQRRMLVVGLVLWGSGQLLFSAASSAWTIAIALVLWAAGIACYSGMPYAMVINGLRAAGRDDLIASTVRRTHVTRWIASAAGALAVFLLVGAADTGMVIAVASVLLLLLAGWVRLTWAESPRRAGRVRDTLLEGARAAVVGELRVIAVVTAISSAGFAVVVLSWQPLAVEAGLPVPSLGAVLVVFTVASAGGAALARFGERRHRAAVTVGTLTLAAVLCTAGWGAAAVVVALVVGQTALGFVLTVVGMWSHATFPDHLRSTMVSIMGVVGGLSMALTDAVFGVLWSATSITTATGISGVALLALLAAVSPLLLARPVTTPAGALDPTAQTSPSTSDAPARAGGAQP
ncbi:MFS transporter [Cellulomonas wangsupingiae]|uniref:MFS transporter n=1 Tax=Cellulomonas wangsupingiae TaxID=2968085 RepID=UPI001D0DD151|nr:MFS transporter [Cellulomonas wangsupingiae]MCM0638961.1 MFS transporter [Cellulomonas wangsupingiae]